MDYPILYFFTFLSSGGWVKIIKLSSPHFHSQLCFVCRFNYFVKHNIVSVAYDNVSTSICSGAPTGVPSAREIATRADQLSG